MTAVISDGSVSGSRKASDLAGMRVWITASSDPMLIQSEFTHAILQRFLKYVGA
jgi:hypothetical protein